MPFTRSDNTSRWWRVALAALLLMAGLADLPLAHAQDGDPDGSGLSESEQVLLERLYAVLTRAATYQNYQMTFQQQDVQEFRYLLEGQTPVLITGTLVTGQHTVVHESEDEYNLHADMTVEVQEDGPSGVLAYNIDADVRVVDGQLYVQGQYTAQQGAVPELPAGWVQIGEEDTIPEVFAALNLPAYRTDAYPIQDIALLQETVTNITLSDETLDDGTPVDRIQATFTGAGFEPVFRSLQGQAGLSENDTPLRQAIFQHLEADKTRVVITVYTNRDNTPLRTELDIALTTGEIPLVEVAPDRFREGEVVLVRLRVLRARRLDAFNAPDIEPATAPDVPDTP